MEEAKIRRNQVGREQVGHAGDWPLRRVVSLVIVIVVLMVALKVSGWRFF